jgi:hypothetical protein
LVTTYLVILGKISVFFSFLGPFPALCSMHHCEVLEQSHLALPLLVLEELNRTCLNSGIPLDARIGIDPFSILPVLTVTVEQTQSNLYLRCWCLILNLEEAWIRIPYTSTGQASWSNGIIMVAFGEIA